MNGSRDPGLVVIRTTLEAALQVPFSLALTSAGAGDGKTATAVGLARSFAEAGYRTAIIDANPASPGIGQALGVGGLTAPRSLEAVSSLRVTSAQPNLDAGSIANAELLQTTSSSALRAFAADLRGLYAVTIWDTGTLFGDALSIQCATACDGVLITVRYGRRVIPDDLRMVPTLEQVGARVIGVIPTAYDPDGRSGRSGRSGRALPSSEAARPTLEFGRVAKS